MSVNHHAPRSWPFDWECLHPAAILMADRCWTERTGHEPANDNEALGAVISERSGLSPAEHRLVYPLLVGFLVGGLAAGGVHFHDSAPWGPTALVFAGLALAGFLIAHFQILL